MLPGGMTPQVILLREGTDTSQGTPQLLSNINACLAVADAVRTTLGPCGFDKLIHAQGAEATISNDGATIMKLLSIVHPAAKTLTDIARSQDSEVGDGTTTVVLLASEFLKEAKPFVEDGVPVQAIIAAYRTAADLAISWVNKLAVSIGEGSTDAEKRAMLEKCAGTSLNSKLVNHEKEFFASMIVEAVLTLDQRTLDHRDIGFKKVQGGHLRESFLVDGVAFKKTFSYAGFEQQPKSFEQPKVLALNIELELKAERDNAEVRITDPEAYQRVVDAEWNVIYEKLDLCVKTGAKVIVSRLAIGDLATQYFADRDIFCAGRVPEEDMRRLCKSTGAVVQTSVSSVPVEAMGTCEVFEERQVGGERYNLFKGCPLSKSCTIVLRGGAEQFIDEAVRSLEDAMHIVRRAVKNTSVVPGGGAIDMELSRRLREYARSVAGKAQLFINAFAKALEIIPRQLCDNAGLDATDVLNKLRQKHAQEGGANFGVDVRGGMNAQFQQRNDGGASGGVGSSAVIDTYKSYVWEPSAVKLHAVRAACDAACLVLSVDETVRNPRSEDPQNSMPAMGGRGGGRGRGMGGRGRGRVRR